MENKYKTVDCGVRVNLFPNDKFRSLPNSKCLPTPILNLMKMAKSSPIGSKTLWEKEKLLVTGNFSFSCIVFKKACTADT